MDQPQHVGGGHPAGRTGGSAVALVWWPLSAAVHASHDVMTGPPPAIIRRAIALS